MKRVNAMRTSFAGALAAAVAAAGLAGTPVRAEDAETVVHEVVVTAEPGRILTRQREYRLAPGAAVMWQGGHPADVRALRPDLRVTLELDAATLRDPRPLVRAVILPLQ